MIKALESLKSWSEPKRNEGRGKRGRERGRKRTQRRTGKMILTPARQTAFHPLLILQSSSGADRMRK